MSSPIVDFNKTIFNKLLIAIHKKTAHSVRIDFLVGKFSKLIDKIHKKNTKDEFKCLDIGCGDMTLAEEVGNKLHYTSWICVDIHKLPDSLKKEKKWEKYIQFNGSDIDFNDNYFDIVIMSDILHHASEGQSDALLKEAARVGKNIIVKDNFEYSLYSRSILRFLDFLGNYGYGVSVPKRYYTPESFSFKVKKAGMKIVKMDKDIGFYSRISIIGRLILPNWQFIATLKKQG
jgi:ubiquinone/menaquinone biosynthesis C-methylase UbiE